MADEERAPPVTVEFVDIPTLNETFADNIRGVHADNQGLRIEFCVTRVDPAKPGQAIHARAYPVCRLVLPGPAVLDLINKMKQVEAALVENGVIKTNK